MRLPKIKLSLANKCRVLFGSAVLLILAAALFVPWYRMSELADRRYMYAARVAANNFLIYEIHRGALGIGPATRAVSSDTRPAAESRPAAWPAMAELGAVRILTGFPPDFVRFGDTVGRSQWLTESPFGIASFGLLSKDPAKGETFQIGQGPNGEPVAEYATVVRAEAQCLRCHAQGEGSASKARFAPNQPIGVTFLSMPVEKRSGEQLVNSFVIIAAGLVAGLLAVLVFYLISQKLILWPVRELKGVAQQVSGGDLSVRSQVRTGDEFEELADTFNRMLTGLKLSQDQLTTVNRSLDTKLGELAEANVSLFEANKVKSEFLANVSHELRTPLNSIIGFADLLADRDRMPEQVVRYADNIRFSGKMLLEMINELLDLAKIEAGKMELRIERISVKDVCESLIDFTRPLADRKGIELALDVAPGVPIIETDPGKLQQILYNLMSNAVKFTPQQGRVSVTARNVGIEEIRVSVSDTGPGIAREHHAAIFEKFRQVDGSVTKSHGGTGLGLAIARELTLMLGGRISVESELGQGATFHVVLPLKTPPTTSRPLLSLT